MVEASLLVLWWRRLSGECFGFWGLGFSLGWEQQLEKAVAGAAAAATAAAAAAAAAAVAVAAAVALAAAVAVAGSRSSSK